MNPKKLIIGILTIYALFWLKVRFSFTGFHIGPSNSKEESIKDKIFLGEYEINKDTIELKNGKKVFVPTPWIEKNWYLGMGILPKLIKKPKKGISILIEVKDDKEGMTNFFFKNKEKRVSSSYSVSPLGAYKIQLDTIPDELELFVEQKKDNSWQETIVVDKIKLKRKKEHSR